MMMEEIMEHHGDDEAHLHSLAVLFLQFDSCAISFF